MRLTFGRFVGASAMRAASEKAGIALLAIGALAGCGPREEVQGAVTAPPSTSSALVERGIVRSRDRCLDPAFGAASAMVDVGGHMFRETAEAELTVLHFRGIAIRPFGAADYGYEFVARWDVPADQVEGHDDQALLSSHSTQSGSLGYDWQVPANRLVVKF